MYYLKIDLENTPVIKFAHTFLTDNYSLTNRVINTMEIVYIEKGVWLFNINGYASYNVKPGETAILPPGIPHSISINAQSGICEHSCVNFTINPGFEILDDNDLQNYKFLIGTENYSNPKYTPAIIPFHSLNVPECKKLLLEIISTYSTLQPGYMLEATGLLFKLLAIMTKTSLESAFSEHTYAYTPPMSHVYCRRIIDYLNMHYSEKVKISDIANEIGLNPHYMCNLFNMTTGDTIINYLNRTRIEKSKELLITTTNNISDICKLVGFENEHYFSKVFRKHQGSSPGRFRIMSINNLLCNGGANM
jgi:Response regulator containing CheY-like receiver domain and AraC-type DNA-binding domain